jgi:hypothetical protein
MAGIVPSDGLASLCRAATAFEWRDSSLRPTSSLHNPARFHHHGQRDNLPAGYPYIVGYIWDAIRALGFRSPGHEVWDGLDDMTALQQDYLSILAPARAASRT